jgi:hypothetical protein
MEEEEAAGWCLSLVSCTAMDWLALKPSAFLSKSAGRQMGNSEGLLAESWMISRDRIGYN